jgi:hypothetical protein
MAGRLGIGPLQIDQQAPFDTEGQGQGRQGLTDGQGPIPAVQEQAPSCGAESGQARTPVSGRPGSAAMVSPGTEPR